jgi:hypothetical protein
MPFQVSGQSVPTNSRKLVQAVWPGGVGAEAGAEAGAGIEVDVESEAELEFEVGASDERSTEGSARATLAIALNVALNIALNIAMATIECFMGIPLSSWRAPLVIIRYISPYITLARKLCQSKPPARQLP